MCWILPGGVARSQAVRVRLGWRWSFLLARVCRRVGVAAPLICRRNGVVDALPGGGLARLVPGGAAHPRWSRVVRRVPGGAASPGWRGLSRVVPGGEARPRWSGSFRGGAARPGWRG